MRILFTALAFAATSALACPYDDVKDAQAPASQAKSVAAAKAPTPVAKTVAKKPSADAAKVAAAKPASEQRRASPL